MEQWLPVVGYEKRYAVSDHGRVFDFFTGKYVAPQLTGIPQYYYVNMRNPETQERKLVRVSRLVAFAFHPKPEGKDFVDHIDRNPHNNRASNLRWVCHTGNQFNRTDNWCLLQGEERIPIKLWLRERKYPNKYYACLYRKFSGSTPTESEVVFYLSERYSTEAA